MSVKVERSAVIWAHGIAEPDKDPPEALVAGAELAGADELPELLVP